MATVDRNYYIPWALVSSGILTRIKPSTLQSVHGSHGT